MPNVTFYRVKTSTELPSTTQGAITFNTHDHCIYLGTGDIAVAMDNGLTRLTRVVKTFTLTKSTEANRIIYSASITIPGIVTGIEDVQSTLGGLAHYFHVYYNTDQGLTTQVTFNKSFTAGNDPGLLPEGNCTIFYLPTAA